MADEEKKDGARRTVSQSDRLVHTFGLIIQELSLGVKLKCEACLKLKIL
jgi:hypothetical protein